MRITKYTEPVRITKHIQTSEDWHPNRENDTVKVSLLKLNNGEYRVCLWGNDDFGMEFGTPDLKEANRKYYLVYDFITQKELQEMGFNIA